MILLTRVPPKKTKLKKSVQSFLFFRAILSSEENGVEGKEIPHRVPASEYAQPPSLIIASRQSGTWLQWMNPCGHSIP